MKNKYRSNHRVLVLLALSASLLLSACGTTTPTLYQWEGYQPHVYSYLKADGKSGPEQQIVEMEADLQKIRAKGNTPPPGYYAHLGMLNASIGRNDQVLQDFQQEKKLFPESAPYMDYLLSKLNK
jgi:hypothetical protein